MKDYLGETIMTNLSGTPYVGYTKNNKAKTSGGFIWKYVEDYDHD